MRTDFQLAWPPKTIGGHSPVKWSSTDRVQIAGQFRRVLVQAKDEMPIQKFFEDNPVMLLRGLIRPHTAWVIPRPIFPLPQGGGGVPDFVLCEWSSVGPRWIIVELESPTRSPVTKSSIAAICTMRSNKSTITGDTCATMLSIYVQTDGRGYMANAMASC